jgi:hypothetical protein
MTPTRARLLSTIPYLVPVQSARYIGKLNFTPRDCKKKCVAWNPPASIRSKTATRWAKFIPSGHRHSQSLKVFGSQHSVQLCCNRKICNVVE